MSETLQARSEVLKLARILSVDEERLTFLRDQPSGDLREFREQVTERMFDASSGLLTRVAAAAKLMPSGLVAGIAQKAFGPLLCARAAGAVDTGKAIDVCRRLPPVFLADAAVEVDPRRVADIIAAVPRELVVPVAKELGERQEYVTMGRFLAFVADDAIVAAIGVLDDEALLRTAFVLEHKDRLDHAIGLLPETRLPGVLRRATELELWPEALDLLDQLSDQRRGPIADIVAEQDHTIIAGIVEAVAADQLWESLLPVVGLMSDGARRKLAAAPAFHDHDVIRDILRAASVHKLWAELVPLIEALPEDVRGPIADLVSELDEPVVDEIVDVIAEADLWSSLLPVVRTMSEPARQRLAAMPAFHQPARLEQIVRAAAAQSLWADLVPLIRVLPQTVQAELPEIAAGLEPELLSRILGDAAQNPQTLTPLLAIVKEMDEPGRSRVVAVIDGADRRLAEELVAGLADLPDAGDWLRELPTDARDAVDRAAERFEMTDVLARVLQ